MTRSRRRRPRRPRTDVERVDTNAATSRVTDSADREVALPNVTSALSGVGGPVWLATAIGAGAVVSVAYLATHGHPAYEGGLYVEMAEAIQRNGFRLPGEITGYTAAGVPFAYPPLLFYAIAALVTATGVDPVALELYVPALVTVVSVVPYYGVARRLLPSERQAGLATVLYAVTPPVLQWHLSAGGVVRAPAMLLTLAGLYAGIRLFETGERRWLAASTGLFALTLLAHPVYAAFFGLSYVLLFAGLDRSVEGLVHGAVVAVGGLLATAPWWLAVVDVHGIGIFLGLDGTRTTFGGSGSRLLKQFVYPVAALDAITPFYVAAFAGGVYATSRRRFLLPAWMVVASYGLGEDRFTFVAGSMLSAMLLFEVVLPGAAERASRVDYERAATVATVVLVIVGAGGVGAAYAGSALDTVYDHSTTMPQTVHSTDREAMAWARENTEESADFLVVGDQAEWFPYYADRTILVSPWGTEWTSPERFERHIEGYEDVSACESAACLEWSLGRFRGEAEYVYVPKQEHTVRGKERAAPVELLGSLRDSERFERRYENEGVVIFEVDRREERGS